MLHFTSNDLEQGNASKRITPGIGVGEGDWRLVFRSGSSSLERDQVEFLAYARTTDGFLTSLHDLAPSSEDGRSHYVPIFNPGSNAKQQSWLRLINTSGSDAAVTIQAWDDSGTPAPGGALRLTIPAQAARSSSAKTLEDGGETFRGALGDGTGKWRLFVESDRNLQVMSLLTSPEGHITNLSTSTVAVAYAPPVATAPCIGATPDRDDDGLADDCDEEPRTAYRALSGCSDGTHIDDPEGNPLLVVDCEVLVAVANAWVQDLDLGNTHTLSHWGLADSRAIEDWTGVRVRNGRVTGLSLVALRGQRLSGPIPPEIGRLVNLTHLDLSSNELTGPIPPELGQLVNLRNLILIFNELTGPLPAELGHLSELRILDLGHNQIGGPIPPEFGQLTKLRYLYLFNNRLTGPLPPELGQLESLERLSLSSNNIAGPIPPEFGQLAVLETMSLGDNQLTGTIPAEIGSLGHLESLSLGSNDLSGTIPPELGQLERLTGMGLNDNRLTGTIPPELGHLATLDYLYLNGNQLTGTIPPELGRLFSLRTFNVADNELTGPIPSEFGALSALRRLDISNNRLTGRVPVQIFQLTNVAYWGVAGNQFTGNAAHHSVSYYQGPLTWEWDWRNDPEQHQRLVAGRWMALVLRVDHDIGAPAVDTSVLSEGGNRVGPPLEMVGAPKTSLTSQDRWRTEYVLELPGRLNRPGNQLVHEIDPEDELPETDERDNTGGRIELNGEEPPRFKVTFIPLSPSGAHSPEVERRLLLRDTLALLPIADDYWSSIGQPLQVDAADKFEMLNEVRALWNAEADQDEFYHGIFDGPWPGNAPSKDRGGGVAHLGGNTAVSQNYSGGTVAHEFGHNLNLSHAPGCGAEDVDVNFPYADGGMGPNPGWHNVNRRFVSTYYDFMSYCQPRFISAYHYEKAADFWLAKRPNRGTAQHDSLQIVPASIRKAASAVTNDSAVSNANTSKTHKSSTESNVGGLALSGYVDAHGRWYLTHAQTTPRSPRVPAEDGEFTIVLEDADGAELHREPLTRHILSDGDQGGWAARIPIPPRPARRVRILNAQGHSVLDRVLPSSVRSDP